MTFKSKRPGYERRYSKMYRSGYRVNIDATVTARKVRALQAIGHSLPRIAEESGVGDRAYLSTLARGDKKWVWPDTEKGIADYYDRHHLNRLDDVGARKVITNAKKRGYAPPLAWDDIENLDCEPVGVRK